MSQSPEPSKEQIEAAKLHCPRHRQLRGARKGFRCNCQDLLDFATAREASLFERVAGLAAALERVLPRGITSEQLRSAPKHLMSASIADAIDALKDASPILARVKAQAKAEATEHDAGFLLALAAASEGDKAKGLQFGADRLNELAAAYRKSGEEK